MKFYIVDAFTEEVFGGNPAGVVLIPQGEDFLKNEIMVKIAAELRYSETAFVKRTGDKSFHVRYFTPVEEVDLCGHATIGTFYALMEDGVIEKNADYRVDTLAGNIKVSLEGAMVMMDMAPPEYISRIKGPSELKKLYEVMGLDLAKGAKALTASEGEWELYPEIISTGLPEIMMPVKDREELLALKPDMGALIELSRKYGVVGVHAFALGEALVGEDCCEGACDLNQVAAYCRNFAPAFGIDEEAATGTANGALTYYLYKNVLIDEGSKCSFLQGEAMNRPSMIMSSIDATDEGVKIRVGGYGALLAKGELCL